MYSDGLEIAGIGVGMVFLALVAILVTIVVLRVATDAVEKRRGKRSSVPGPPATEEITPAAVDTVSEVAQQAPASEKVAKAAAIAVALFLAEEVDPGPDQRIAGRH